MMEAVLEQNRIASSVIDRSPEVFGEKIGLFGSVFGCWHKDLGRPFTLKCESYRACLNCGARKRFDTETLKTTGRFHYPPAVSHASARQMRSMT
jgi:hypothetical protein